MAHADAPALDLGRLGMRTSLVSLHALAGTAATGVPDGWRPGPLPVALPAFDTEDPRHRSRTADAAARRTLVAPRLADLLYGPEQRPTRAYLTEGLPEPVLGLEVVALGDLTWLVVHQSGFDPVDPRALPYAATAGPVPTARAVFCTLAGPDERRSEHQVVEAAYLALTGPAGLAPSDLAGRAAGHRLTLTRTDWSALVLRDGAAFVAHQRSEHDFAPSLRALVHSIHTDALLLAHTQRRRVDELLGRLSAARLVEPVALVRLETDAFDFNRSVWSRAFTQKRNAPADEVLAAAQGQLMLEEDVADLDRLVADGARLAISRLTDEQERSQRRLTATVSGASVVLGAIGVAVSLVTLYGIADKSARILWTLAIGAVLAVVAQGTLLLLRRRYAVTGETGQKGPAR